MSFPRESPRRPIKGNQRTSAYIAVGVSAYSLAFYFLADKMGWTDHKWNLNKADPRKIAFDTAMEDRKEAMLVSAWGRSGTSERIWSANNDKNEETIGMRKLFTSAEFESGNVATGQHGDVVVSKSLALIEREERIAEERALEQAADAAAAAAAAAAKKK
jgi:hypothetical protein